MSGRTASCAYASDRYRPQGSLVTSPITRPATDLGDLQVRKPLILAAGQDRDEQEFAKALELFMEDNNIQNALEAFAQSCSQHSRDLRSV
jgi:hypothetical protein